MGLVWLMHVVVSLWWLQRNPLPNGFQNEILHLGNALDIWVVYQFDNLGLLHDFLFKGYWPPLVYVTSMVPVSILGPSRDSFVAVNFGWLALLMGATFAIGRRLFSPGVGLAAAILISFFPSIYGNVVRFEPNIALTAVVTLSIWTLIRSSEFTRSRWALLFGVISGVGLLVDRLAYGFFIYAPSLLAWFRGLSSAWSSGSRRSQIIGNGIWSLVALLVVAGYYHSFFFAIHSEEIFSQAAAGEIIETGEQTERRDPLKLLTWLFYPLTLMDSQVGPVLALVLVPAVLVGVVLYLRSRPSQIVLAWLLGSLAFFSLVQKKQVFYTIPLLPAVALLAAAGLMRGLKGGWRVLVISAVAVAALLQYQALMTGESPLPSFYTYNRDGRLQSVDLRPILGRSPLPGAWVSPRYPQARPPDDHDLRMPEVLAAVEEFRGDLPVFRVGTYSDDHVLYEGYLTFFVRAANPYIRINGLMGNLQAFYEWARAMDLFIYVTSESRTWPPAQEIDQTLSSFHRQDLTYPVADLMENLEPRFELQRSIQLETGATIYFYTPLIATEETTSEP